jgi:hypothetical protein
MNYDLSLVSLPPEVLCYLAEFVPDPDKLNLAASTAVFRRILKPVVEVAQAELRRSYKHLSELSLRRAASVNYRTTFLGRGTEVDDAKVLKLSRLAFRALNLGPRCALRNPVFEATNKVRDLRLLLCPELVRLDGSNLRRLANLQVVDCTSLQDLSVESCQRLKSLTLRGCYKLDIKKIDFNKLSGLRSLHLEDLDQLEHLDLSQLKKLKRVTVIKCPGLARHNLKLPEGGVNLVFNPDIQSLSDRLYYQLLEKQ